MTDQGTYIDNDQLEFAAREYINYAKGKGGNPEPFGVLLIQLHDNILRHANFRGYNDDVKDEMRGYSIMRILRRGLNTWKPETGKLFSYLTRAIFHNYITILGRYYRKLNNHRKFLRNELAGIDTKGNPKLEQMLRDWGVFDNDEAEAKDKEGYGVV